MDDHVTGKREMNDKNEPAYAAATFEQKPVHIDLDYGSARKVFIFGDVHGNIDPILRAMDKVGYDHEAGDRMISLGDWLDRGNHTTKVAKFIERHKDDLRSVKGNHEQMLEDAVRLRDGGISPIDLIKNGGKWILEHLPQDEDGPREDRDEHGNLLMDHKGRRIVAAVCGSPVALTITTPAGHRIGVVHGEMRRIAGRLDWNTFTGVLQEQGPDGFIAADAMWERDEIRRIKHEHAYGSRLRSSDMVENIDHVFHGHTILKEPLVWGNRSWIDIASYKRGETAFIDVDRWTRDKRITEGPCK